MRVELLMNLRPPLKVIEASIHSQGQLAEFVSRLVVLTHGPDGDRMRYIAIGGLFRVSVGQRETDDGGGDEARQDRISKDVGRGPDVGESIHHHPRLRVAHDRQINERFNAALAQQGLDGFDLAFQGGLLFLSRIGEGDTE
jgi:hypothetical protein